MAVQTSKITEGKAGATPRDRYAELLVIIVVLIALLVAWGVKAGAQARAVHININGFQASYGHDWIRQETVTPEILRIFDPGSGARFGTTIIVTRLDHTDTNEQVARVFNQERLRNQDFFQFLDGETIQWRGRETYRNQFAYVYVSPDLLNPQLPVVLHGMDYVFQNGATTYVVTLLVDESVYQDALVEFGRFLDSVTPG
ncbi:MAG: hypothetical protein JXA89_18165 [Anaerolineae bacterium]|nr:hypothetical protein [Anaerolineae bacterium]